MVLRILRPARHAGWLAFLAAAVVTGACSSNSTPVPDAFVAATVGAGGNGNLCNIGTVTQWVDIGVDTSGKPTTQKDGSSQGKSSVSISCSVSTSGSGFDLQLSAGDEGDTGGSLIITSPSGQGVVTPSGGSGLTGVFNNGNFGAYRDTDCTLSFTYMGTQVPDQPPLAAGRIWGHISCPHAQTNGKPVMTADGGVQNAQCDGEADFLFEQCTQ
jgi:hypothetical protein